jgi:hypothetical protein
MIYLIDNVIDAVSANKIEKQLYSLNFPWYFTPDASYGEANTHQHRPGFLHWFAKNGQQSSFLPLIEPLITNGALKLQKKEVDVIQIRAFLQLPLNPNYTGHDIDTPHIDLYEPHWVMLYYVNDNDADTVIYSNKMKNANDIPLFDDLKESVRVKPNKGRMVIFDGMHWHTALQTTTGPRCIININIKK